MELITIHKDTPVVEHTVIAEQTNNKAINIAELIQDHKPDFEDFGTLSVSNRESGGGRPQKIYNLNEQQATLLMTYLKNTPIVRKFKIALVKAFYELREREKSHPLATTDQKVLLALTETSNKQSRDISLMHDYLIHNLKPKDHKRAKAGHKGAETKLKKKIEKLENQLKELKAEEKNTRADFRVERDRANRLQTKLDNYKKEGK